MSTRRACAPSTADFIREDKATSDNCFRALGNFFGDSSDYVLSFRNRFVRPGAGEGKAVFDTICTLIR
jgi:hypothetical protein